MISLRTRNPYNHLKRIQEIFSVLIKYGFYNQLRQIGLLRYLRVYPLRKRSRAINEKLNRGQRLCRALEELGPAFVKLGQFLSTRHELLPQDIILELNNLQDRVTSIPFEKIKELVEEELQGNIEDLFLEFDKTPLAAASIAQVHRASLKNGENIVLKIQRPNIERVIYSDLAIMEEIASYLDHRTRLGKLYDFTSFAKEFRKLLSRELDFRIEERNINTFSEHFKEDENIIFPYIYKEYCTKKILAMEYIEGYSIRNVQSLRENNLEPNIISKRLCTCILIQILKNGFFHGDPHPGNIKVLPGNKIVFFDMGIIGRISEERRFQLFKIITGITLKNSKLIVQGISELGDIDERMDIKGLERDMDGLWAQYLEVPLREIKMGEFLSEVLKMTNRYKLRIPNEFTMIAKTLITLESIISRLDPQINIMEIAQPITKELMGEMYSPQRIKQMMGEGLLDISKFVKEIPSSLLNLLHRLDKNDTHLLLQFKNEERIVKTLNKIANQLSFSVALLALSIVISGFIVGLSLQGDAFSPFGSIFVTLGLIASITMGLWLIISIIRTGRF